MTLGRSRRFGQAHRASAERSAECCVLYERHLLETIYCGFCLLFIRGTENDDGLCCRLTKACPKEPEPIPFKDLEVKRHEIVLAKKLGQGQFGEVWAGMIQTDLFPVLSSFLPVHVVCYSS